MNYEKNPLPEKPTKHSMNCDEIRELIPAYSIGATDADETQLVEQMLADCPGAVEELAEYRALEKQMLHTTTRVPAPPEIANRLLKEINSRSKVRERRAMNPPYHWFTPILAVVAIVLLVVSNLFWQSQLDTLQAAQEQLSQRLEDQESIIVAIGTGKVQRFDLVSQEQFAPYASVLWESEKGVGVLYTSGFPMIADDKVYQLWLIQGDKSVSAGLFQVDAQGYTTFIFRSSERLESFDMLGITIEPVGGSLQPTTQPIVVGST